MSKRSTQHVTFVIERDYPFPPARVYAAWADPAAKAQWFAGPAGKWSQQRREMDFRIGGRERVRGKFVDGWVSDFDACYHDIVQDERIVYSYTMHVDEKKISVSLATVEFKHAGAGTRLVFTEQGAYLDGYDDSGKREQGTAALLDNLDRELKRQ